MLKFLKKILLKVVVWIDGKIEAGDSKRRVETERQIVENIISNTSGNLPKVIGSEKPVIKAERKAKVLIQQNLSDAERELVREFWGDGT
jgi:hypothetical protein